MQCFWWNIKSPRWLSLPTAQIWCPMTSGFFQNENHLWKERDYRLSMRFRKIRQGSWWQLGELCEVPRCLLWRGLRLHCPVYSVSCIFSNKCLFFLSHGWIFSGQTSMDHAEMNLLIDAKMVNIHGQKMYYSEASWEEGASITCYHLTKFICISLNRYHLLYHECQTSTSPSNLCAHL